MSDAEIAAALRLAYTALWRAGTDISYCPVCYLYIGDDQFDDQSRHSQDCELVRALAAIEAVLPDVKERGECSD